MVGNVAGGAAPDFAGTGSNFSGDFNVLGSGNQVPGIGNRGGFTFGTAKLGPLTDNGGHIRTHELLPGSPAIDAGDPAAVAGEDGVPLDDQRGDGDGFLRTERSRVSNGRIDIGAYERQAITEGLAGSSIATLDLKLTGPVANAAGVVVNYDVSIANVRTVEISKDSTLQTADERALSLGEVEFFGANGSKLDITTSNGSVSQSSDWPFPGFEAGNAIDADTTNFTHTAPTDVNPSWRITFPSDQSISSIRMHNRDNCCTNRLSDITVRYLDADGEEIYRSRTLNPNDVMTGPAFIDDGVNVVSRSSRNSINGVLKVEISKDTSELTADARVLAMADIEFIGADGNRIDLAGVTASQSSEWPSGTLGAGRAIDTSLGSFNQTGPTKAQWWRAVFPSAQSIAAIRLHNRPDGNHLERLRDITVRFLDANDNELYRSGVLNPGNVLDGPPSLLASVPVDNGAAFVVSQFDISTVDGNLPTNSVFVEQHNDRASISVAAQPDSVFEGNAEIQVSVNDFGQVPGLGLVRVLPERLTSSVTLIDSGRYVPGIIATNVFGEEIHSGKTGGVDRIYLDAQGNATATITLGSQPTNDVTLSIGTFPLLTFTPENWSIPQGIESRVPGGVTHDGTATQHTSVTLTANSLDPAYEGANLTLNVFDEPADVQLLVTEGGTRQTVKPTVSFKKLNDSTEGDNKPAVITVSLDVPAPEGGLNVFYNAVENVNQYQLADQKRNGIRFVKVPEGATTTTIPVNAVDDFADDGDVTVAVSLLANDQYKVSGDASSVQVKIVDNDTAGIELSRLTSGTLQTTDESDALLNFSVPSFMQKLLVANDPSSRGASVTVELSLKQAPTANVTLTVADQHDPSTTRQVTFTPANFSTPQSVSLDIRESSTAQLGILVSSQNANVVGSGRVLRSGDEETISSPNGSFQLIQQFDGNLVLHQSGTAIWASAGNGSTTAVMQGDGNLVQYNGAGTPLWASNTAGNPGAYLAVEDSGQVVIYSPGGERLWESNPPVNTSLPAINLDYDRLYFGLPFRRSGAPFNADTNLSITEGGEDFQFGVRLTSQPTQNLAVIVEASGNVSTSLGTPVFTAANWDEWQPVILHAIEDQQPNSSTTSTVTLTPSTNYSTPINFNLNYNDDDDPLATGSTANDGTIVAMLSAITDTVEEGQTGKFRITLSEPAPSGGMDVRYALNRRTADFDDVDTTGLGPFEDGDDFRIFTASFAGNATTFDIDIPVIDEPSAPIDESDERFEITLVGLESDAAADKQRFRTVANLQTTSGFANNVIGLQLNDSAFAGLTLPAGSELDFTTGSDITIFRVTQDTQLNSNSGTDVPVELVEGADAVTAGTSVTASVFSATTSAGGASVQSAPSAEFTLKDNDDAGITVTTSGTAIAESGQTQSITAVLQTKPRSDVHLILGTDSTEAVFDGENSNEITLTFTPDNWNVSQSVTIRGVDDDVDDGNVDFKVRATVVSDDREYSDDTVPIRFTGNDHTFISPGFTCANTFTAGNCTVILPDAGSTDVVTADFVIDDPSIGDASVPAGTVLKFARTNPGNRIPGLAVARVESSSLLNNGPGSSLSLGASDAASLISASQTIEYPAFLRAQSAFDPTSGTVVLGLSCCSVLSLGLSAGRELVFDNNAVAVVEEDVDVGNEALLGIGAVPVKVRLRDGVSIPKNASARLNMSFVTTSELMSATNDQTGHGTIDVQLTEPGIRSITPLAGVFVRGGEILARLENHQSGDISFTPTIPQAARIQLTQGLVPQDARAFFQEKMVADLTFTNVDNDAVGVTLTRTDVDAAMQEGASNSFFSVRLNSEPTSEVEVRLTPSDDNIKLNGEVAGEVATIRFNATNWNLPQAVEVTAVDDDRVEFNHRSEISTSVTSTDANYNNLSVAEKVNVFIVDDDLPAATVRTVANAVEANAPGYFVIELDKAVPSTVGETGIVVTYTVQGTARVNDPDAETDDFHPIPGSVRIAPGQKQSPIIAFPIDDAVAEGENTKTNGVVNPPENLVVQLTSGTDSRYRIGAGRTATLTVDDNDEPGVRVISPATLVEGGSAGQLMVSLLSQPTSNVTITIPSSESKVALIAAAAGANANSIQLSIDANANVDALELPAGTQLTFGATTATVNATSTIVKGKSSSVSVSLTGGLTSQNLTTEYSYQQLRFPQGNTLTFTGENWYQLQPVPVEAIDDSVVERAASHTADVSFGVTSADSGYNGFDAPVKTLDLVDRPFDAADTSRSLTQGFLSLQDSIENVELPILGKFGDVAPPLFEVFIEDVAAEIRAADNVTVDTLRTAFNTAIGNTIGNDSPVTFEVKTVSLSEMTFGLSFMDSITAKVPLNGNLGLEALDISLESSGTFDLTVGYDVDLGFGISKDNGFFIDTTSTSFGVTAGANLSEEFTATGSLGFLQVDVKNGMDTTDADPTKHDNEGTGVNASFTVAIKDPAPGADTRLTLSEMVAARKKPLDMLTYTISGDARLDLDVETSVGGNAAFPSFSFNLSSDLPLFNYSNEADAQKSENGFNLSFSAIELDLGEFVRDLVTPVVTTINDAVDPIRPVIEVLDSNIELLEKIKLAGFFDQDGDKKASLLEVAIKLTGGSSSTARNFRKFADAIIGVVELSDSLSDLAASLEGGNNLVLEFGDYTLNGFKGGSSTTTAKNAPVPASGGNFGTGSQSPANKAKRSSNRKGREHLRQARQDRYRPADRGEPVKCDQSVPRSRHRFDHVGCSRTEARLQPEEAVPDLGTAEGTARGQLQCRVGPLLRLRHQRSYSMERKRLRVR